MLATEETNQFACSTFRYDIRMGTHRMRGAMKGGSVFKFGVTPFMRLTMAWSFFLVIFKEAFEGAAFTHLTLLHPSPLGEPATFREVAFQDRIPYQYHPQARPRFHPVRQRQSEAPKRLVKSYP